MCHNETYERDKLFAKQLKIVVEFSNGLSRVTVHYSLYYSKQKQNY